VVPIKLSISLLICLSIMSGINAMNYPYLYQDLPQHVTQQQPVPPIQQPQAATQGLEQLLRTEFEHFRIQQEHTTQRACTAAVNKAFAKVFLGTLGFYLLYKWYTHNNSQKKTHKYYARS